MKVITISSFQHYSTCSGFVNPLNELELQWIITLPIFSPYIMLNGLLRSSNKEWCWRPQVYQLSTTPTSSIFKWLAYTLLQLDFDKQKFS